MSENNESKFVEAKSIHAILNNITYEGEEELYKKNVRLNYYINTESKKIIAFGDANSKMEFIIDEKTLVKKNNILNIDSNLGDLTICLLNEQKLVEWITKPIEIKKDKISDSKKEEEDKIIAESFYIELKKPKGIEFNTRKHLKSKILDYLKKFKSNGKIYYGPFTVFCQSSGYGKTKACLSLKQDFNVVYVCLRSSQNLSAFPKRSEFASMFTDKIINIQESKFKSFCIRFFNLFIVKLNNDINGDFYDKNLAKDEFSQELIEEIKKLNNDTSEYNSEVTETYLNYNKPLLFVFDEAREMTIATENCIVNFFSLRNVISTLKGEVFALFLDTFSVLSSYMPERINDPSARVSQEKIKLLNPIYLMPNWDAFADYELVKNIQDSVKIENVCRYGRPLWGALYQSISNHLSKEHNKVNNINYSHITSLANYKITCSAGIDEKQLRLDHSLALWGVRIGAIRSRCYSTNQSLVAKNMAVCTYANVDETRFEIDYPSEPILAEASAHHLDNVFNISIKLIREDFSTILIDQGRKGEMMAKMILIKAIDQACYKNGLDNRPFLYLKYIQVGEFLKTLYGKCDNDNCGKLSGSEKWYCKSDISECPIKFVLNQYENVRENAQKLLNAYLNFNHFTIAKKTIELIDLKRMMKRCAAVDCLHREKGVDLLIPIVFGLDNFDEMSAILIQVKLHKIVSKYSYNELFTHVNFESLNIVNKHDKYCPYLMLFMQLGNPANESTIMNIKPKRWDNNEDDLRSIIYSQGLNTKIFSCLDEDLVNELNSLAQAEYEPFKSNSDDGKLFDMTCYVDNDVVPPVKTITK